MKYELSLFHVRLLFTFCIFNFYFLFLSLLFFSPPIIHEWSTPLAEKIKKKLESLIIPIRMQVNAVELKWKQVAFFYIANQWEAAASWKHLQIYKQLGFTASHNKFYNRFKL